MDPATYEYQSVFGRHCVATGRAEGRLEGTTGGAIESRCSLLIRLLTLRFNALTATRQTRIREASIAELDVIGERVLTLRDLTRHCASVGGGSTNASCHLLNHLAISKGPLGNQLLMAVQALSIAEFLQWT